MFEEITNQISNNVSNFIDAKKVQFNKLTSQNIGDLIKQGSVVDVIKKEINEILSITIDKVLVPETKNGSTYQVKFDVIGDFDESKSFNYSTETIANGRSLTYAAGNEPEQLSISGEIWQNSAEINELEKSILKAQNKLRGFGGLVGGNAPSNISKMQSEINSVAKTAMGYVDLIEDYADYANSIVEVGLGLMGQASSYVRKIQNIKTTLDFIGKGHLPCSFGCWGKQYTGYYLTSLNYKFSKENPYSLFVSMSLFKPNITLDEDNFTYTNKESGMSSFVSKQQETDSFGSVESANFGNISEMTSAGLNVM